MLALRNLTPSSTFQASILTCMSTWILIHNLKTERNLGKGSTKYRILIPLGSSSLILLPYKRKHRRDTFIWYMCSRKKFLESTTSQHWGLCTLHQRDPWIFSGSNKFNETLVLTTGGSHSKLTINDSQALYSASSSESWQGTTHSCIIATASWCALTLKTLLPGFLTSVDLLIAPMASSDWLFLVFVLNTFCP